ncbi:sensitivity to high expression protein she9, partial [Kappamyces sp. JEL0680]
AIVLTKLAYESVIEARRAIQKDLDVLKDRKSTLEDITRLTDLYKQQLSLEVKEKECKDTYKAATDTFEKAQMEYLNEMRERYVEEQMYSDKIRRASTWWTWGLITTNMIIFLTIQLVVEPKRKRDLRNQLLEMIEATSQHDRVLLEDKIASLVASLPAAETGPLQHSVGDTDPKPAPEEWTQEECLFYTKQDYWVGVLAGALLCLLVS